MPPYAVKMGFDFERAPSFGMCDRSLMFLGKIWRYSLIGKMLPWTPLSIL